ncbi:hypothetical protein QBC37DRAFT_389408 [Rhypophila decipiens]|uniref:Uncharacterized protein n=1 Tax=Rhypophila decipiens TaxID=261697 RepID=A0AAN6Y3Y0_9PEZI|nr:hypothetical protein QBC37DRAFT_389408 [Rhypophila decipiens]
MRLRSLFSSLWVLSGSLVVANTDTRALELEYNWWAYRMDVEVSTAEFLSKPENAGKNPNDEKPWQLGRNIKASNLPEDWPRGPPIPGFGLNVHAYTAGIAKGDYGRVAARTLPGMDDPWNPDFRAAYVEKKDANGNYVGEPRTIMRLPRDSGPALDPINSDGTFANEKSPNKYSFQGFDPDAVLGPLNGAKGVAAGNYFQLDNQLAIVAKRCSQLYQKNPDLARPYYEKMARALENAQRIRLLESRGFQIESAKTWLKQYEDKNKIKGAPLSGNTTPLQIKLKPEPKDQTPDSKSWSYGWRWRELDIEATEKEWPKGNGVIAKEKENIMGNTSPAKGKKPKKGALREFAELWGRGDFTVDKKVGKKVERKYMDGFRDAHIHLQALRAEERLSQAIREQIDDPNKVYGSPNCKWYDIRPPNNDGIKPPIKKRLLATLMLQRGLDSEMTPA